ncbi:MAG TPA: cytochrome c3 family protein [Candidatus Angelobacter sp.]|nr:cytochrome c3 family protein [Candidatus Angelobacter sp.]
MVALWAPSHFKATTVAASAQNSTGTTTNPPAQNEAANSSITKPHENTSASSAEPLRGPVQPVPFSHKEHAGTLRMPCQYCHTLSRSGETLLIPRGQFCMQCHANVATDQPGVRKLAEYAKTDRTIPWVRIYELPSFVSFSHKVHLQHGATCAECHGQVAQRIRLYQESDISMATCVNCHRAKQASTDCSTCHILEQ